MDAFSTEKFDQLFKELNPAQREAVESIEGTIMVLAGPGTGKTQVVAMRIAQILKKTQIDPKNILALTFTEAGVTALKKRLSEIIGPDAYQITVSTFHGFAKQIIDTFPYSFAVVSDYGQLNDLDRYLIIDRILKSGQFEKLRPMRRGEMFVGDISTALKTCKQEAITPENLEKLIKDTPPPDKMTAVQEESWQSKSQRLKEFCRFYRLYQDEMEKNGRYDYEDLILFVNAAIRKNADIRAYLQERYQYLLVDEYQDTNNGQNALVEAVAEFFQSPNLFVVGDDKQAIYRFQGASVANMLHFKKKYPDLKVIALTKNYRNTPEILTTAAQLISHNETQISKFIKDVSTLLEPVKQSGDQPKIIENRSPLEQHAYLLDLIKKLHRQGVPYHEMAILFRKREPMRQFRQICLKNKLPVSGEQTVNLFESGITKQLISLLKAIENPHDDQNVFNAIRLLIEPTHLLDLLKNIQIINKSRLKPKLIEKLIEDKNQALWASAQKIIDWNIDSQKITLVELYEKIISEIHPVKNGRSQLQLESWELIATLSRLIKSYAMVNQSASLKDWLEYLETMRIYNLGVSIDRTQGEISGIYISTVHGAKGMEFDAVIMADADEKNWSNRARRTIIDLPSTVVGLKDWHDDQTEDERRLFYVGLTRARKYLYLTYPQVSDEAKEQLPCQFVTEIESTGQKVKPKIGSAQLQKTQAIAILPSQPLTNETIELEYIRSLLAARAFSFTDLKTYQVCPRQFLLRQVLRLPEIPSSALIYGSAVHKALEKFFLEFKVRSSLPSRSALVDYYHQAIAEDLPFTKREEMIQKGTAVLEAYYRQCSKEWRKPVAVEYSFTNHQVMLDNIWLTGKFDKIEQISEGSRSVRIIDYKTKSSPMSRNQIEGLTQDSDGSEKKQLIFYAMLSTLDRSFPYQAKEFVIAFIDDKLTFKTEMFKIDQSEIEALEKETTAVYQEILKRKDFPHTRSTFDRGCEVCQLFGEF